MDQTVSGVAEQLSLAGIPAPRPPRRRSPVPLAEHLPVAGVVVDRPQPHLDRVFEYAVPAELDERAVPGVRVKVRFAGQDVDGFVVSRHEAPEHDGVLTPLRRVVSGEPVLSPEVLALVRAMAARCAGTVADVLRLAVPPRHARVEQEVWAPAGDARGDASTVHPAPSTDQAGAAADPGGQPSAAPLWEPFVGGTAFLRRLATGDGPRAVWQALPGRDASRWTDVVAAAVVAVHAAGRGALVVVPSGAEVDRVVAALDRAGLPAWQPSAPDGVVRLVAEDGPSVRYRSFLAALRGAATVVVGTRAAMFAPVRDVGLLVCWDDGSPLHAEPRAPYPHAREVLAERARLTGAGLLVGGFIRTVATQRWVSTGWARPLVATREVVRRSTPRIQALTSVELAAEGPAGAARLPAPAWRALRDGLARGPVLVQVPRAGYVPVVACQRCRTPARCPDCSGALSVPGPSAPPQCRSCGRLHGSWTCGECGGTSLRSVRVGSQRTAEELGRAFPGAVVRSSGASTSAGVIAAVGPEPALVVATPGAEPRAEGGYVAAVLLDAALMTARLSLDSGEQALRTWMGAAALVRPAPEGIVLLVGDALPTVSQALVRWDPAGFAERELREREQLALPPALHHVAVDGPRDAVMALLGRAALPAAAVVLGPAPVEEPDGVRTPAEPGTLALGADGERMVRALVRAPWAVAGEVTAALRSAQAVRSARGEGRTARVRVEPADVW